MTAGASWRDLVPLPDCGRADCDWQVSDRLNVTCAVCGLADQRASKLFRLLEEQTLVED